MVDSLLIHVVTSVGESVFESTVDSTMFEVTCKLLCVLFQTLMQQPSMVYTVGPIFLQCQVLKNNLSPA